MLTFKQRILHIHFPHLATDRIARHKWGKSWRLTGRPDAPPLAVIDKIRNAYRLVALEEGVNALGLQVMQSLSDARAIVPVLDVFEADPKADQALLKATALWCIRYTPLVALANHDGLFLDISGCAHLFGGEQALLADCRHRLTGQGFGVRLAIADTAGAAWAVARYGKQQIVPADQQRTVLPPLPLAALRLPDELVSELNLLGLKTIDCVLRQPSAPLTARFGPELLTRLNQALGTEGEPLNPLLPVAELMTEKRFFEPIQSESDVKQTINLLAANCVPLLQARGLGARALTLTLFRVDGEVVLLRVEAANPLRDGQHIAGLFAEKLAGLHSEFDAGFGFDVAVLCVVRAEPLEPEQGTLAGARQTQQQSAALIDRLGARLGAERVQGFVAVDTHIPERAFFLQSIIHGGTDERLSLLTDQPASPAFVSRPLVLFDPPEPVEALAQIPESPPARLTWRKARYQIIKAEGPERIAGEWWNEGRGQKARDYYRLEEASGLRFWLFRLGLYGRQTTAPQWFMHGLFA